MFAKYCPTTAVYFWIDEVLLPLGYWQIVRFKVLTQNKHFAIVGFDGKSTSIAR